MAASTDAESQLSGLNLDPEYLAWRVQRELPWHLFNAEMWSELADYVRRLEVVRKRHS
jgi:hypothetical protein